MTFGNSIILDTDIGYDPDDLFALILLNKLAGHRIRLIVTANEFGKNKRLQFLSQALTLMDGCSEDIVPGVSLGLDKFTVDELLVEKVFTTLNHHDFTRRMAEVIRNSDRITYIGIGGFTNLAKFIDLYPKEAKRMKIFLMGGSLDYERYPGWVEYNVKIDPGSVAKVINADLDLNIIMAQTTHNSTYEIGPSSLLFERLKQSNSASIDLLCRHCDLWFKKRGHGTSMHDPLTIVTALGYDFISFQETKVVVRNGKFILDNNGHSVRISNPDSRALDFMSFLERKLCG